VCGHRRLKGERAINHLHCVKRVGFKWNAHKVSLHAFRRPFVIAFPACVESVLSVEIVASNHLKAGRRTDGNQSEFEIVFVRIIKNENQFSFVNSQPEEQMNKRM
jgi:hypothetical protein